MNFSINLATRVYVDFKKVNLCFGITAGILGCWVFFSIYSFVDNAAQLQKFADYQAKVTRGTPATKVSESDYNAFLGEVKTVNGILYKRSYDWLSLLANLEQLVPEGVALRRLEPADKGAELRLSAAARNFSGVRKFIENLESSKVFSEINLTDQAVVKEKEQKGITFSVTCKVAAS